MAAASLTPRPGPGKSAPRAERLRRREDFVAVLQAGRRFRHRLLSLGVRPNGLGYNRVGYAIGKRVGTAVVRNRVRRRLREIARVLPLEAGYDLVLTGNPDAATAGFADLRTAVAFCARRAGLLAASEGHNGLS